MKKQYIAACLAGVATLCLGTAANADVVFNNALVDIGPNPPSVVGQSGFDLGMSFTVNCPMTVSAMGTFDANLVTTSGNIGASLGAAFFSSDVPPILQVAIYNVATGIQVPGTYAAFSQAGNAITPYSAIGGSIFQNVAPVTIAPGDYAIVATGYTFLLQSGNTALSGNPKPTFNILGGGVTLDLGGNPLLLKGASYVGTGGNNGFLPLELPQGGFPTAVIGQTEIGGSPDYLAGTFQATCNCGVPDGGTTIALLGVALTGIAGLSRKLKS
jgi:hypothetical protein